MAGRPVVIDGTPLRPSDVVAVARDGAPVTVAPTVAAQLATTRDVVEAALTSHRVVYGVTTGFGALADTIVPPDQAAELQHALVRSHAAGIGPLVGDDVVRAMTALRARTLATGHSGVRVDVVEAMAALLNAGIRAAVPLHGSLGASGDLAPMAHVASVLTGEGWVIGDDDAPAPAAPALARAGLRPLALSVKEGLALLNATEGMLATLVLACEDLAVLADTADVVCAMSVEALLGTDRPFAERLQQLRPHPGQGRSAANLRLLLDGSGVLASHRHSRHAVQDAYSLRCAPQVHGAARDALSWGALVRDRELASVVDNPVVFADGSVESTGNFHGEPVAFALDLLALAAAEIGAISERRTDRLLDPARSHGLAPFLAPEAGLNSGFMLGQYTAASLVAENRRLAVPASADSIPTSGMQEDHVSMGWSAGMKLRTAIGNLQAILGIEALVAAAGLEQRLDLLSEQDSGIAAAPATRRVLDRIRTTVEPMRTDRFLAADIAAVRDLVRAGALVEAAGISRTVPGGDPGEE
ncbi:MAG TPA: histidine ammonia-lyase [Egibacteraceae bacterium]|nr:histidine ammonia-lyase [Egibacteraceae bacterium]